MRNLEFIAIVFVLLSACKNNDNNLLMEESFSVNISEDEMDNILHNPSFVKDMWKVKLEDTKDNLIGHVKKILTYKNYIYIYDSKRSTIFIFDLNTGRYINKIDKKGKGPNEYIYIEGVYLNSQGQLVI